MKFKPLTTAIEAYLKSEVDGLKITAKAKSSALVVVLLTVILGSIFGLTALLFANVGLAFLLADIISEMNYFAGTSLSTVSFNGLGFLAVAGMYLTFFVIFLLVRPVIVAFVAKKIDNAIQTTAQKNIEKLKK